jgi:hypothetical protein
MHTEEHPMLVGVDRLSEPQLAPTIHPSAGRGIGNPWEAASLNDERGSPCNALCDYCWCGTEYENNCPTDWFYDDSCDCGCQYCDAWCDCGIQDCLSGGTGACCGPNNVVPECIENTEQGSCLDAGGAFMGDGATCASVGGCANRCDAECVWCWTGTTAGNNCNPSWNGDGECDCGCQFCDSDCPSCAPQDGACCGPNQATPECIENCTQAACFDAGGAYMGHGVTCAAVDGCQERCAPECVWCWTGTAADNNCNPSWSGDGECDCGCQFGDIDCPSPCGMQNLIDVYPPNCTIDARQPHALDSHDVVFGWDSIELTFDCDPSGLGVSHFNVQQIAGSVPPPPSLESVTSVGNTLRLQFSAPINVWKWTCISMVAAPADQVCLGYLPADINGDLTSAPSDILWLIDCLNGVRHCEIWQCDIDRSQECMPPDILRVIDLLNGAALLNVWSNRSLIACPSQ